MYKVFVILIFALFVGTASYLLDQMGVLRLPLRHHNAQAENIINDLEVAKTETPFPKELQQIHQVFISDHRTEKSEIDWKEISIHYFPQKTNGLYDLQIEVFDDGSTLRKSPNEPKESIVILQFSLFEVQSRNKIWELSRSFDLLHLNTLGKKSK